MRVSKANVKNLAIGAAVVVVLYLLYVYFITPAREGFAAAPSDAATFTMYYADWCPHCKTVKPVFANFAGSGSVDVGGTTVFVEMVEAEQDPSKIPEGKVKGYPTFLFKKAGSSEVIEYQGERDPAGWMAFLKENL